MTDARLNHIWTFVRGDMPLADYEKWLYSDGTLEQLLGNELYLTLVSADYRDSVALGQAKRLLEEYARTAAPMNCECIALPDTSVIDMVEPGHALEHFDELRRRGEPYWWLHIERCRVCQTGWLVAQEERQNDVFLLHRLTAGELDRVLFEGVWPTDFDLYETLLRLGKAAGHSARFLDPIGDSSLDWTMADLARQRPGISVAELADLLNLDLETASVLADKAILTHGVRITMGDEPWR